MKKYLQSLLLLVAFVLPFGMQAQVLVSEDFEGGTCPPTGWTMVYANAGHPDGNDMTLSTSYAHSGTHSFRFSSYSSGSPYDQYLITPALELTSNAQVSFYYHGYTYGTEYFTLGYSTTDSLPASFTWGDEYVSYAGGDWELVEEMIPANARYVAIHYYSNYAYYLYVDDFTVEYLNCPKPSGLTISDLDARSATVSWSAGGTETQWVGTITPAVDGVNEWDATDTSYSFTNLTPETRYTITVAAYCGACPRCRC